MTEPTAVVRAVAEQFSAAADAHGRPELVEVAAQVGRALDRGHVCAVVGDFKRGKTSLVNALLAEHTLPVDDAVPTAVPTVVRHGPSGATLVRRGDDGPTREPFDPSGLARLQHDHPADVTAVELVSAARILALGYELVDCPPAPPSHRPARLATMQVVEDADLVVVVTDCTQPLTGGEIDLLEAVTATGTPTVLVETKVDLAANGDEVLAIDRGLLSDHDLDVAVLPMSAELRMRAVEHGDADLNNESGVPDLIRAVAGAVADTADARARRLAQPLADAIALLEEELGHQIQRIDEDRTEKDLATATAEVAAADRLRSPGAIWQRHLAETFVDIQSDATQALTESTKRVATDAERTLADLDPKKDWDQFEQWVRNVLVDAVDTVFRDAAARCDEATRAAKDEFLAENIDVGDPDGLAERRAELALAGLELDFDADAAAPGGLGGGLTAMRGGYSGFLMFGMFGSLVGIAIPTPVTIAMGIGMGTKAIKDERGRQVEARRNKALVAARTFLDLAGSRTRNELAASFRGQQRVIRESLVGHAEGMAEDARARAEALRSQASTPESRANRRAAAERDRARLQALRDGLAVA